ncbi:MAG: isoleucine--tRNA ligase [archaeon]
MYNPKEIETEILEFWNQKKIYPKAKTKNKGGKKFYFLQGPPYANGKIHIGTAWNNCLKDMIMRYKRLQGYNVWDRGGFDTHGLPIVNQVRKNLNIKYKQDIQKFGVAKFVKECRNFAEDNIKTMSQDLKKLGVWMNNENPYKTLSNEYIDGEWFFVKKAWDQKRIYKDKKIIHWCADCETGLAKHELAYKTVKDNSIFLKFKTKANEYLIVWTTTPWTIPFNLAVMVNPTLDYVKVKTEDGEIFILAKILANIVMASVFEKKFKIIEEFKGKDLKGTHYVHPFYKELKKQYDEIKTKHKNLHTVVLSEQYVDTSAGSGLVHCAPGCGPEDKEVGEEYHLPAFNNLNEMGIFEDMGEFTGMIAKKEDPKFIDLLKKKGALLKVVEIEHEYPLCDRCKEPVIFRATEQWFLKIQDLIPKLIKANQKVDWVPRFGQTSYDNWTKNLKDNSIVRQRYWGCPLPLWKCVECGKIEVIGSIKELKKKSKYVPEDLHKPFIDEVTWKCKCGGKMARDPDILDVWIDAGTCSWNCLFYPAEKKHFKLFPADLILEATEQVRLWFSMLNICSMIAFGKNSYRSCYMHGMILDWQGTKMSKSKGNVIFPDEVLNKSGTDVFRYYMFQNTAGENMNFNWKELEIKKRNLNILWNTKNYLTELADKISKPTKLGLEEKYILSRLNSTILKVTELFDNYKLDHIITEIENLFLDLSRVYIKLVRDKGHSKEVVYTIYEVLNKLLILFAPICPFITDKIYQDLRTKFKLKEESIHLLSFPKANKKLINKKLESQFGFVLQIIEKGLAERDKIQIGLKWPLKKAIVYSEIISKPLQELIKNQLNVKKLEIKKSKEIKVELDTELTPELEAEGFARVVTREIQSARKQNGLKKENKIKLNIDCDEELEKYIKKFEKSIIEKVNTSKISFSKTHLSSIYKKKIKNKNIVISVDKI